MLLKSLREQVYETAQQMVIDHLAYGSQGNVSALDRERGLIAITPTAIAYAKMSVEDIVIIDLEGTLVEARWKPTSETPMHLIFYQKRTDVGAVVHTHAPFATLFGVTHEPIPVLLTEAATCLGAEVPVAPYCRPGTPELAQTVLAKMGTGEAVLLAQHGLLSVGADLGQAYDTAMAAETSAHLVIMTRSMGAAVYPLPDGEVEFMRNLYLTKYKPYPVRVDKKVD
jgi:L-ribulose-5-phosphate 4-epimerase